MSKWGLVLLVSAMSTSALADPPAQVELTAPWSKLDLASGSETKIYKSVGAKKPSAREADKTGCTGAITNGICWHPKKNDNYWVAQLTFDTIDDARAKLLDAWGPSDDLPYGTGQTLRAWYLHAGKNHLVAHSLDDGDPFTLVEIQEMTPFADVVAISQKLVGKKRTELAKTAGKELLYPCDPKTDECYIAWGPDEMTYVSPVSRAFFDGGETAVRIGIEIMCDKACDVVPARLEAMFGKAEKKTCDYKAAQHTILTFSNGMIAAFVKGDDSVHGCVGRCGTPCK